jgi:5-methylcytosine-specific restriction endonuclease McrA
MADSNYVKYGMSQKQFDEIQERVWDERMLELRIDAHEDWHGWITCSAKRIKTYSVHGELVGSCMTSGAKTTAKVRKERTEEYYESAAWILIRNEVLWESNFTCMGCGKEASEVHHQAYHKKYGNYPLIGKADEDEKSCLVSICHKCHTVITNLQNKKRWPALIEKRKKVIAQEFQFAKNYAMEMKTDNLVCNALGLAD